MSAFGCGYKRIGDLTLISNRNIEPGKKYTLVQRNVEGIGKMKKGDALEQAIDNATELHNGDYLMNTKIFIKDNGKKVKVVGDVYQQEK